MKYLLDTDWIIDHFSGRKKVTRKLIKFAEEGMAVSIISVAELYEGIHGSKDYENSLKTMEDFLKGITVLNIDMEVCNIFGRERNKLRKSCKIIGDFDLLIASICLKNNLILLTNNTSHFDRIDGLNIISIKS